MPDLTPLRFLVLVFAGWVNCEQTRAIAFLAEENRVLREHLGEKRGRLADDQRRRLAAKGKVLDRLLHHGHVLNIRGRSYRLRDLDQRVAAPA